MTRDDERDAAVVRMVFSALRKASASLPNAPPGFHQWHLRVLELAEPTLLLAQRVALKCESGEATQEADDVN
jgi:hypothetical protein